MAGLQFLHLCNVTVFAEPAGNSLLWSENVVDSELD